MLGGDPPHFLSTFALLRKVGARRLDEQDRIKNVSSVGRKCLAQSEGTGEIMINARLVDLLASRKMRNDLMLVALALLIFISTGLTATGKPAGISFNTGGPWPFHERDKLTGARMFAEGIVSTNGNEFGGVFTPDGKEFYFTRSVPQSYFYMICVSRLKDGKWSEPEAAPFSGRYRDFDAVISPDGSKLYFVSDRPVDGKAKADYDIWLVERIQSGWSEPKNLGSPINTDGSEWFASVSRFGTLYFAADRSGGFRSTHIFRSRLINGKYSEPEKLSGGINSENIETEPYIAPDESFLLFSSYGREGGSGDWDIYISYNHNGEWTDVQNLGPKINTSTRDYSPRLTPDGKYLFFTSERNFYGRRLEKHLRYQELRNDLRSTLNGNGNIYQIELDLLGTKP